MKQLKTDRRYKRYSISIMISFSLLFCLSVQEGKAQALPFFQLSGYGWEQLNPAHHLLLERGTFQVLHRKQSPLPGVDYRQTSVGFSSPIQTKTSQIGLSVNYLNDDFSLTEYQQVHLLQAALSYALPLNKQQKLGLGLSTTFFQQQWDYNNYSTGSQWVPNVGYDPTQATGEALSGTLIGNYWGLNAGMMWSYTPKNYSKPSVYLGVSGYFLNKPSIDIVAEENVLQPIYSIQAGSRHFLNKSWELRPQLVFRQDYKETWISFGSDLVYQFDNYNPNDPIGSGAIGLNLRAENRGLMAAGIMFEQSTFAIGASYEFVLSSEVVKRPALEAGITLYPFRMNKKRRVVQPKNQVDRNSDEWVAYERKFDQFNTPQPKEEVKEPQIEIATEDEIKRAKMKPIKYTLYFEFNKIVLDAISQKQLDYTLLLLKDNPQLHVDVVGHSDNVGSFEAKERVAWFRANYVYRYLKKKGISKEQMKLISEADRMPIVSNDTAENRAKNRRVELLIFEP
ncbi:type IX secretion system PorP/SprF family membrane protein [Sediminitomix flava]|uniref:Type IX secretion system PorP/SprF family membrane protein n=2 Tax=Sediminitomix flava TaxID=379075 RepID=A0A315ZAX5_SEDFL|nr:type IX secretion system PorP/SprF family membrane protein [Sediminitomix flava]